MIDELELRGKEFVIELKDGDEARVRIWGVIKVKSFYILNLSNGTVRDSQTDEIVGSIKRVVEKVKQEVKP